MHNLLSSMCDQITHQIPTKLFIALDETPISHLFATTTTIRLSLPDIIECLAIEDDSVDDDVGVGMTVIE